MIRIFCCLFGPELQALQSIFRTGVIIKPWKRKLQKKPSVDHLRIFGSPVYIHVPKEKRTKLEPLGKKGTFVGYSETSKAYRIYVPRQNFIEVSRDVTFHEEAAFRCSIELPCDTKEQEAPSPEPSNSPLSDEQREEAREPSMDPIRDSVEFPLEKPPVKKGSQLGAVKL
jgi:hypothetical protein